MRPFGPRVALCRNHGVEIDERSVCDQDRTVGPLGLWMLERGRYL